jgi:hypothetical protein
MIRNNRFWIFLLAGIMLLLWQACQPGSGKKGEEDRLLAKVYNKSLYLSDLEGMIPASSSSEDSSVIINAYLERWVRDASMMHEAERNVPKDLNIDDLVRDYRASLIRHNYEQLLIEEFLDSTVTNQELKAFYDRNKEQYQLEDPILRCHFIKVPKVAEDIEKLDKWWESEEEEDFRLLVAYCNSYASLHLLEDSTWYRRPTLEDEWPAGVFNPANMSPNQKASFSGTDYRYYFKLIDYIGKDQQPPLSYVSTQAKKVILHKRKMKLLDDMKERMYERALRRNDVKIY